jgi:glycosyltransferase involved in cell wall biosynthesis
MLDMKDRKLAITHDHLFQIGGAERVLLEFHKIYPKSPIYTLICNKRSREFLSGCDIRTSYIQKIPLSTKLFKLFLTLMPKAWESFDFSEYDVILSSASAFAKGIVKPKNATHFCYCHTPTRYLWSDMEEYVDGLRVPGFLRSILINILENMKEWDYKKAQEVDYFIANSKFIAQRIKKYYNKESHVIYPPVDVENFYSDTKENYYILVSRLRPYKKIDLAIQAFNQLKLPLKIIGGGDINYYKSKAKNNIEFLGEIGDEEKFKYLSRAKAFIHPQEEDFGISLVEALASGCPVIAYKKGGALETMVDGKTGVFFEEQNWPSLAEAILDFNKMNFDHDFIKNHAQSFSKERFETEIANYINEKLNENRN